MEHRFGSHVIREEGSIAVLIFDGNLTPEDMRAMFSIFEKIIDRHGHYGAIVNAHNMGRVTPGARKVIGQSPVPAKTFGTSVFGASLTTRTVITLVIRALQLVGRGPLPLEFFKTEAEARAWITERSQQAAAQQAGP